MKLAHRACDKRDVARDEFRDAVERYNAEVITYNTTVDKAHNRLADAFFDILDPAIKRLAEAAREESQSDFDELSLFAATLDSDSVPRAPYPAEPMAASIIGDDILSEFENLPVD